MCIISVSASCRRKIQSRRSKPELCRSRKPEMHNLGGNGFARELMLNEHNLLRVVLDRFDGLCLLADNRFALTSQSNLSISQIGNGPPTPRPLSADLPLKFDDRSPACSIFGSVEPARRQAGCRRLKRG